MTVGDLIGRLKLYGPGRFVRYGWDGVYHLVWQEAVRRSYSQLGEDLTIDRLLGKPRTGFYVDVGAHDPRRFSNTKRFYDRGWRGINIDPNPDAIAKFNLARPRDINLNIGIGSGESTAEFFALYPDTLSTFDRAQAQRQMDLGHPLRGVTKVRISPLSRLLDEYLPAGAAIDFMSVDTEGFELEVIGGCDWERHRPRVLCLETAQTAAAQHEAILTKLRAAGYERVGTTTYNEFFTPVA